jgi:pimeloyl-ACP methyl ester carboxylesterase
MACAAASLAVGCAAPFAVTRNPVGAQRTAIANVISTGEPSRRTMNVLYERNLTALWKKDPKAALAALHQDLVAGKLRTGGIGASAELSFDYARRGGGKPYYLASALYAWAYLFPDDKTQVPDRLDPATHLAREIYNRGITQGLSNGSRVELRSGSYPLPFGTLEVTFDEASLVYSRHQLWDFYPLTDVEVSGFPTNYRWPGIGAPLAAKVVPNEKDVDLIGPRIRVPVTAVLQPASPVKQLRDGTVHAALVLYPGYGDTKITIDGEQVPLESEPTAALGLGLSETKLWKQELSIFMGDSGFLNRRTQLVSTRPYRRGLIPVVMVHGTGSSAIRWAELYNELDNDPRIHDRYQFWFFSYDSGNPIPYSASLLRQALEGAVSRLDPEKKDPALRRMIVMGHSQGGLLTRMTVVDSGDAFWRNLSSKPFDEVTMSPETRSLLEHALFVKPLPFVERVVFVATPHHGSYMAGSWLAHQGARLISMPVTITKTITDFATVNADAMAISSTRGSPTAVDNMTPGNPFVKTLASLPISPRVAVNSIIPVDGDPPYSGKNDGVVEYDSAHIEPVESELVVRSKHSCQAAPATMEEVRRILLHHLDVGAKPAAEKDD